MGKVICFEVLKKVEYANPDISIVDVYSQDKAMHDDFLDNLMLLLQKQDAIAV